MSISRWCVASGLASGSPERAERCAQLAGDVPVKAVALLNTGALGLEVPAQKTVCRSCHHMGPDFKAGQITHAEMDCVTCHIGLRDKDVSATGRRPARQLIYFGYTGSGANQDRTRVV